MNRLQGYFEQFRNIKATYEGQKTDWEQKYSALKCLHDDISNHKIQNSKNAIFYEWIQRKLQADIWDETNRVYKLKEGVY